MVEPLSVDDVAEHATRKDAEYKAKKRAKIEKPSFASDKGDKLYHIKLLNYSIMTSGDENGFDILDAAHQWSIKKKPCQF